MNEKLLPYLKEIGRGAKGSRGLTREQAAEAWGWLLDGEVDATQMGAFCMAMRMKGETAQELAGFLDATEARLTPLPHASNAVTIVLPSYNGARRLPVLTPLLAALLQREGLQVVMHGLHTESNRIATPRILEQLPTELGFQWVNTEQLCPGLARLLQLRISMGLRNAAHSIVKLMNPAPSTNTIVVGSYTHPEFAELMAQVVQLQGRHALLLRGTEGEPVADARRLPTLQGYLHGQPTHCAEGQSGSLQSVPALPDGLDATATARYILQVLEGELPVPAPIAQQVALLVQMARALSTS